MSHPHAIEVLEEALLQDISEEIVDFISHVGDVLLALAGLLQGDDMFKQVEKVRHVELLTKAMHSQDRGFVNTLAKTVFRCLSGCNATRPL